MKRSCRLSGCHELTVRCGMIAFHWPNARSRTVGFHLLVAISGELSRGLAPRWRRTLHSPPWLSATLLRLLVSMAQQVRDEGRHSLPVWAN